MAYVSIADRDHEIEHHDPQTFITKYVWSQDHKVIAVQYSITAIFVGVIRPGPFRDDAPAAWLPRYILLHQPGELLPVRHYARHDHGDLSADGIIPRRIR